MCLNFPSEKSTHVMQSCQNSLAIWCAVIQRHLYKTTLSKKVLHVMFVHRFFLPEHVRVISSRIWMAR